MKPPRETSDAAPAVATTDMPEAVDTLRYSVDLFDAFGAVCDKAKSGVQSCQAIATFVHERANMEAAYARSMNKIAVNAKADDWAPAFANCWHLVQETLAGLGKVHTDSAAKMQSTMVAGVRAFAAQQEIQVQRLIAEGTKFRTAQQNMQLSLDRAEEKYDRRCAEAIELASSLRRNDSEASVTPQATQNDDGSPVSSSLQPAMSTENTSGDDSVGQLLTKMWDTTSAFAKPSVERQRSKLESSLDELLSAEKVYAQTVEHVNTQRLVLEREITENLHAFQLTEEQRIEYLKDLFRRLEKLILKNLETAQELIKKLREETNDINEFGDIEEGFRKLSNGIDPDTELLDPNDNPFYQRMCQVQGMSERGHHIVRVMHTTLVNLASQEDHFVSSTQRLLRAHDTTSANAGDIFNLSTVLSQVCGEGQTMLSGWKSFKDQTQRFGDVHLELRSLIAEPVILNITTMKQEYEASRSVTHENFAKTHGSLCHEVNLHQKRKLKLESKAREFAQLFSSLPDMGGIDLRNVDVTQALVVVQQLSSTFTDKEKRTEAKLKVVADEFRDAQQRVTESLTVLNQRFSSYIQDVDIFISVFMKNEKFRLQVEKSSMVSLAKALEHAIDGGITGVNAALEEIEKIDPAADVKDFISVNRKQREKNTKSLAVHTNDSTLRDLLDEHRRHRAAVPLEVDDKKVSKGAERKTPSSHLKRTNSHPSTPSQVDKTLKASVSPIEDDRDQPMPMSEFQKKFKLGAPEQVVESYSCALYANNFPNHGRMYLTRDHLCFAGWRDTIYVVSYTDITMMEKKNSAIIVPNAIEITANGEKAFFTSFVFRDECLQCILQLQSIKKATAVAILDAKQPPMIDTSLPDPPVSNTEDAPSPVSQVQVTPVLDAADTNATQPARSSPSILVPKELVTEVYPVPGRDSLLHEYEVVIDEDVPFSVGFAYETLWIKSSAFIRKLLEDGGDTSIDIAQWSNSPVTYAAVTSPDTFDGARRVTYTHNKKYMVGPSSIPTEQTQRFKWDPHVRLVVSVTTLVSDVPYCDYFRAENRWVFSNTLNPGSCKVQVGVRIHWLKSTWLKKQIESTAMGEARESTRTLIAAAIAASRAAGLSTKASAAAASIATDSSPPEKSKPTLVVEESTVLVPPVVSGPPSSCDVVASEGATYSSVAFVPTPRQEVSLSLLQIANVVCLVLFLITLYRMSTVLDQMQAVTREALTQQRQQQELLRELMSKLVERS